MRHETHTIRAKQRSMRSYLSTSTIAARSALECGVSAPLSLHAGATTCFIEINELARSACWHVPGGSAVPKKSGADTPHSKALRARSRSFREDTRRSYRPVLPVSTWFLMDFPVIPVSPWLNLLMWSWRYV